MRVLDEDPALAYGVPSHERATAAAEAVAPLVRLAKGPSSFLLLADATRGHLGLLLLDGMIAREVRFGSIAATEFFGPGDALRPWAIRSDEAAAADVRWSTLAPSRLAALDRGFAGRIARWPEITAALLDRMTHRADSQLLLSALHQARRVEDRVLVALWHLAGRYGHADGAGRTISHRLVSGQRLAELVGARRQTVSTALGQLIDRGAIARTATGFTMTVPPPALQQLHLAEPTPIAGARRRATDLDRQAG